LIGYVTLGTNNFDTSVEFYDQLLESIGIKRLWAHGTMAAWGKSREEPALCITLPHDGATATGGNGVMVALKMADRDHVKTLHAKALELGGLSEGDPGPRGEHGFYGAYFRDLDGNKLCAYVPA
jgi:catechol 2,3-dioxygenase-like lactoylglutathione lyase family enzyme